MNAGSSPIPSRSFLRELEDDDLRNGFVADHVRTRLALLIRALREQRGWSQADLAHAMGTTQSVVSRLEDPDYGKLSLRTLFEVASAFRLPVYIDMPDWEEWFRLMEDMSRQNLKRQDFDAENLAVLSENKTSFFLSFGNTASASTMDVNTFLDVNCTTVYVHDMSLGYFLPTNAEFTIPNIIGTKIFPNYSVLLSHEMMPELAVSGGRTINTSQMILSQSPRATEHPATVLLAQQRDAAIMQRDAALAEMERIKRERDNLSSVLERQNLLDEYMPIRSNNFFSAPKATEMGVSSPGMIQTPYSTMWTGG